MQHNEEKLDDIWRILQHFFCSNLSSCDHISCTLYIRNSSGQSQTLPWHQVCLNLCIHLPHVLNLWSLLLSGLFIALISDDYVIKFLLPSLVVLAVLLFLPLVTGEKLVELLRLPIIALRWNKVACLSGFSYKSTKCFKGRTKAESCFMFINYYVPLLN